MSCQEKIKNVIIKAVIKMFKKYRIENNLTQEKEAELLDISTRHLQRIEKEDNMISLDLLRKMIKLLNISDQDIIKFIRREK